MSGRRRHRGFSLLGYLHSLHNGKGFLGAFGKEMEALEDRHGHGLGYGYRHNKLGKHSLTGDTSRHNMATGNEIKDGLLSLDQQYVLPCSRTSATLNNVRVLDMCKYHRTD